MSDDLWAKHSINTWQETKEIGGKHILKNKMSNEAD